MATNRSTPTADGSRASFPLARGFSSLRIYNYRLYWFGQLISLVGTWMQRLAQAWLVLRLTNSPFALGTVTMLQFLPVTLFSLYGGVLADRFPKRRLLLTTQSLATVQAIVLAALTAMGLIRLWEIYILAAILGLSDAFDSPTRQAFPVELVGRDEVANAIALNSTLFNMSRILGPSLGGIAIATIGIAGCFWLNALSFLGAIGSLLLMRPERFFAVPKRQRGSTRELLAGGLSYSRRTPRVFVLLLVLFFLGTFCFNFGTILPLLSRFTLHSGSTGYGFLYASLGAGSVLAALFLAYGRRQTHRTVFVSGAAFVAMFALVGISHLFALSIVLLLLTGMCSLTYSAATQTRLQVIVPDELRGRVMSLYTLLFQGSTPVGSFFVGTIAERWNVEVAMEVSAAIAGMGLLGAWIYQRRHSPPSEVPDA
jgi:MFS family permease